MYKVEITLTGRPVIKVENVTEEEGRAIIGMYEEIYEDKWEKALLQRVHNDES